MRGAARLIACAMALTLAALPARAQSLIRDAEIENTIARLSAPVFRAASLSPAAVEMHIIDDRSLNAFVFGGRQMALTTGLLRELDRPAQLQGVIAHEIGHITGGHLARRSIAVREAQGVAMLGLLVAIAAGAAAGDGRAAAGATVASQEAVRRALLSYNRAEESAADQAALTYLERAGIDPSGLQNVLMRFRGQDVFSDRNQDPYVRTHPVSTDRLALIDRRAGASPALGREADPETQYWFDRMRAKLDAFLLAPASVLRRAGDGDGELDVLRRAVALHRSARVGEAVAEVDRLLAMRPADPYYHELKGQILLESARGADAVAPLREAARLAPDEPLILGWLGRALLSVGGEAANAEALAMLERGRAASGGGDPSVLRDLALAYARAGRTGEAALVTAERMIMGGALKDARLQAERARGLLPRGSAEWLRADDIVVSLEPRDG